MWPDMKKILLYSFGGTFLTMIVGGLFVMGVFNFSTGAANLIGAEVGLHGSSEIDIHNQIVRDIHDIGNKTKEIIAMIEVEGDITDEAAITALAAAGQDIQNKLKDLTALFEGNSFKIDKQVVKDTFLNDYKPAVEELSYLLIDLKGRAEEETESAPQDTATDENNDDSEAVAKAVTTAKKTVVGEAIPITYNPITSDKKTQITNSCAKLIEAHNKFSDVLNQKRRY
jgi:hypothetical protein